MAILQCEQIGVLTAANRAASGVCMRPHAGAVGGRRCCRPQSTQHPPGLRGCATSWRTVAPTGV
ncbi:MAG: hypothetical protein SF123_11310 [Chloroflexota bacterium]|nr:hypothetical protein [Chloroflexota bacterium]